ncbi:MAG: histone deacetylase [Pirellula sp.]|nr:histone deacetylase [Pirellula sp.]
MKLFYTDHFELPLPDGHRFPMSKYRLLRDRIVKSDKHLNDVLLVPPAATKFQLGLAHDPNYVERVFTGNLTTHEIKRIGFPWSDKMVERSCRSSGATLMASRAAITESISVNLAGGTHHAMHDAGEGYCVFNDSAVTIKTLRYEGVISTALVVDCDVHQGNGTAQILCKDPYTFTFSIHGEKNFPLRKHPGSLDIELPDGTRDDDYLDALRNGLEQCFLHGPFDLMIYLAGADPYEHDRLGRLSLTKPGLLARDKLVFEFAQRTKTPIAVAMAGGYAPSVEDIVDIHAATIAAASDYHFAAQKAAIE